MQRGSVPPQKVQNMRSLKPISVESLKVKKNSFFYDLEFHPIDFKKPILLKEEVYDMNQNPLKQLIIKETLLSPIKLTADYKVSKDTWNGFQDMADFSLQSDTLQHKEMLSQWLKVNASLPISHKFSHIKDFPLQEGKIAIYFYPICYKISGDTTFYMVKGKNQFHQFYCDGIYEIRVR
ncbi:hypothetical protein KV101_06270 [Trueperella sp. zg.1013]|nr:hypothetical protein [Trueperella sp. zg.1013]